LHNVRNALAAVSIAVELNIPDTAVVQALAEFKGVGRRFQHHGSVACKNGGHYTLIEDYGHHPVELAATIDAARGAFPGRRLVLAFQPHRYTRTRDCFEDFVRVLQLADVVWLTEVYAAGETPIAAADGRALAHALRVAGQQELVFAQDLVQLEELVRLQAQDGDVLMCMGAGSIGQLPAKLLAQAGGTDKTVLKVVKS
jgi:UDP-N-acetylmuramate--alanine ligase